MNLNTDLDVALHTAWNMGDIALELIDQNEISYKNDSYADPVTQADCQAQEFAENMITQMFPEDSIIGEEDLAKTGTNNRKWYIDPIDGTNNYCNNRYGWATALALVEDEKTLLSVIYLPSEKLVFFADETGAYKANFSLSSCKNCVSLSNKEQLFVTRKKLVAEANVTSWISKRRFHKYETFFRNLLKETSLAYAGVAGAVEMTNISDNCLDGWIQAEVKLWDYLAGAFIAEQAGAILLDVEEYRIVANTIELAEHLKEIVLRSKVGAETNETLDAANTLKSF